MYIHLTTIWQEKFTLILKDPSLTMILCAPNEKQDKANLGQCSRLWRHERSWLGLGLGTKRKKFISFICSCYHFTVNSEKIFEIGHGVTILWLLKDGDLGALRDTGLRS